MLRRGVGVGALKKREQTQVNNQSDRHCHSSLQPSCPTDRPHMTACCSSLSVSALVLVVCVVEQQTYKEMGAKLEENQMQHVR